MTRGHVCRACCAWGWSRLGSAWCCCCPTLVGIALSIRRTSAARHRDLLAKQSARGRCAGVLRSEPESCVVRGRDAPWFMPDHPDAFPEFVGSFSIVAFAVIAAGAWLRVLPRFWVAFTGFFVWLSLGPFMSHRRDQHVRDWAVGVLALRAGRSGWRGLLPGSPSWPSLACPCCSRSPSRSWVVGAPSRGWAGASFSRWRLRWNCCRHRARCIRRRFRMCIDSSRQPGQTTSRDGCSNYPRVSAMAPRHSATSTRHPSTFRPITGGR